MSKAQQSVWAHLRRTYAASRVGQSVAQRAGLLRRVYDFAPLWFCVSGPIAVVRLQRLRPQAADGARGGGGVHGQLRVDAERAVEYQRRRRVRKPDRRLLAG